MIGIADRGVQLGQLSLVLDHQLVKAAQPAGQLVEGDHGMLTRSYIPHRRPAVFTGASHNLINSSSARSRVTEQPAISSEVM